MAELRQAKEYADYMTRIGWQVEQDRRGNFAYLKQLTRFLAVMKIQRVKEDELDPQWVAELAQKYQVWGAYLEGISQNQTNKPWQKWEKHFWLTRTYNGMLPTATWRIDLNQELERILKRMKAKCRYNIGLAKKLGVKIDWLDGTKVTESPKEMQALMELISANAHRVGYWAMPREWLAAQLRAFGVKAKIAWARLGNSRLAVACFWLTDDGIYYGPNGSTALGRQKMAPTMAIWEAIRLGREMGKAYLDFDGVSDPRKPNKRWLGYTRFKANFGGERVLYPMAAYLWWPNWFKGKIDGLTKGK